MLPWGESFRGSRSHVRCILHIFNLIARVILAQTGADNDEGLEDLDKALSGALDGLEDFEDDPEAEDDGDEEIEIAEDDEEDDGLGDDDFNLDESVLEELRRAMGDVDREELIREMKPIKELQRKVSATHLILCPHP